MDDIYNCYNGVVGLSKTAQACTAEGRPEDFNESNSGIYISDLMEISDLLSMPACDENIWAVLEDARANAVKTLVKDCNALLIKKFVLKREPAKGEIIGQIKEREYYDKSKNYAVITLRCNPIRSGIATIKEISTLFEDEGAVELHIYDNVNGHLQTLDLETQADTRVVTPVNIKLDMFSKYTQPLEYYLVYAFDEDNRPKDNQIKCNCGNFEPVFDTERPYYNNISNRVGWSNYVMVGSTEINSLAELDDLPSKRKSSMLGLVLDMDFTCSVNQTICNGKLDFEGNPLALSLAFAVKFMSGIYLADKMLMSTELERDNLVNAEDWEDSKAKWQDEYNEHLAYITNNITVTGSDCLKCKDFITMTRQGLFS